MTTYLMDINSHIVRPEEEWKDIFIKIHLWEWFDFASHDQMMSHLADDNCLPYWDSQLLEVKKSKFDETKWIKVD